MAIPSATRPGSSTYAASLLKTPHPAFDLSTPYMPTEVRQLYRWCVWVYYNNPVIKSVIDKMTAYIIQDKIFEGDDRSRDVYGKLFNSIIRIKDLESEIFANTIVYGNAFVGILYPMQRFLKCPCGHTFSLNSVEWTYKEFKWFSKCTACGQNSKPMKSVTKFLPGAWSKVSVINWNPQDIYPFKNPWSGKKEYWYKPPEKYRQMIQDPKLNRVFVETTPDPILQAIEQKKYVKLDSKNVWHFTEGSAPTTEDDCLKMPKLFHIFKETWIYMVYRRADEAIAADHVLPFTLVTPRPESGGTSLHLNAGIRSWSMALGRMFRIWRRDQNTIGTLPFPVDVQNIRGDAKALDVTDKMRDIRQSIAALMGMPMDMIIGDIRYSGASVSLRMLENQFQRIINNFRTFEKEFLLPRLKAWFDLPEVELKEQKFKMADDPAQKEVSIRLRQSNDISRRTCRTDLGYDNAKEDEYLKDEREENSKILREQMEDQARAQGVQVIESAKSESEAMLIKSEAQAKAQLIMTKIMQKGDVAIEDYKEVVNKLVPTSIKDNITKGNQTQDMMSAQGDWFKLNVPDHMKEEYLARLEESKDANKKRLAKYLRKESRADKESATAIKAAYGSPSKKSV